MYDTAILIGRFQPLHNGHLALLLDALSAARQVIVVLGSAHAARSPRNPFTWQERAALLHDALPEADRTRVHTLPVRDYYNEARWARAVQSAVHSLLAPQGTAAPEPSSICLIGHFKDASSGYLRNFPRWDLRALERQTPTDATALRATYFSAAPGQTEAALARLQSELPASSLDFLRQFAQRPAYSALQEEWHALQAAHQAWASAPYPPVFVTVDALLRCQGQVLLIRRAHAPGRGLLALPGGFLEPHDTLWQSCLRELSEETHCDLPPEALAQAFQAVRVFDHPARSQRGRTITHVHFFDLGNRALPHVLADDDAAQAEWTSIDALMDLEDQCFEDHFHILDSFLGLLTQEKALAPDGSIAQPCTHRNPAS